MRSVAELNAPDGQALAVRVGIATGLVVVGDLLGDGAAQEEAVVGETPNLAARLQGVPLLFFDGTLWTDDEMIRSGTGQKTGARMGHMSVSGPGGSIAALAELDINRKVFIHINNTNPALLADSPERREIEAAGGNGYLVDIKGAEQPDGTTLAATEVELEME